MVFETNLRLLIPCADKPGAAVHMDENEPARMGWDDEQGRKDQERGVIAGVTVRINRRELHSRRRCRCGCETEPV